MNVSLPDATAYNSKQLAIQKDMTPSLYAMFFKVTYNAYGLAMLPIKKPKLSINN